MSERKCQNCGETYFAKSTLTDCYHCKDKPAPRESGTVIATICTIPNHVNKSITGCDTYCETCLSLTQAPQKDEPMNDYELLNIGINPINQEDGANKALISALKLANEYKAKLDEAEKSVKAVSEHNEFLSAMFNDCRNIRTKQAERIKELEQGVDRVRDLGDELSESANDWRIERDKYKALLVKLTNKVIHYAEAGLIENYVVNDESLGYVVDDCQEALEQK
jgi:hypothetical protein